MAIQFNINTQKAIETVLWIIQRGESNVYNVMKILYAAEKYHLNKFCSYEQIAVYQYGAPGNI